MPHSLPSITMFLYLFSDIYFLALVCILYIEERGSKTKI